MLLPWVLLILLVAHLGLAVHAGAAGAVWPQFGAIAVQGAALVAVLQRYRHSRRAARQLWLLLALAILMQVLWAVVNTFAAARGEVGGFLTSLAVVCSGLYMIPCMFMIARSFDRTEPRVVVALDAVLSVIVAVLQYELVVHAMPGSPGAPPDGIWLIIHHADAVDFSLAVMATLRLLGARSGRRREVFAVASTFLWINAIAASSYNRIEQHGLPWWGGSLLDIAFLATAWMALYPPRHLLHAYRPSPRRAELIASFAPIMLSLGVLMLAVSVSRLSFVPGVVAAALSVIFYGLRVALIQSREHDLQRLTSLNNELLQRQLGRDPLTGIANRATLDTRLREELQVSVRAGSACSLLMIDIDFFKQYNDSLGHVAGDTCLVRVAGAFNASLHRSDDLVARYGGEEFAVVLPNTSASAAMKIAQRLLAAVQALSIPHPESRFGVVTVSIGVATQRRGVPIEATFLLEQADRALYRAKRAGRNRCESSTDASGRPLLQVT